MDINLNNFNFKNKQIIVSVSTGVDSMVLVDLLIKQAYSLVIVHFNHNVREQSKDEYSFIKGFCEKRNIPFEYKSLLIDDSENFQSKARELRYSFLKKVSKKYDTPYIATAHHKSDSIENIISNISQGKSLTNLSTINDVVLENSIIMRPLTNFTKQEIYNYAKSNKIKYYEDISNLDNKYTRNNIRNVIVPALKESFPSIENNLLSIVEEMTDIKAYFDKQVLNLIHDNHIVLEVFLSLDIVLKKHLLNLFLKKYSSKGIINELTSSITNSKHRKFILKDITIHVEYNKIFYQKNDISKIENKELLITRPGEYDYNGFKIIINKTLDSKTCYNNFMLPVIIRTWKKGDYMELPFGSKKLSRIFIDKKVPTSDRTMKPILTNPKGDILYVHKIYKSIKDYHGNFNMIIKGDKNA